MPVFTYTDATLKVDNASSAQYVRPVNGSRDFLWNVRPSPS